MPAAFWILITVVIASVIIGAGITFESYFSSTFDFIKNIATTFCVIAVIWALAAGVIGWLFIGVAGSAPSYQTYNAKDALKSQGVDITHPLPLELGSSIVGANGSISGAYFILYGAVQGSSQPASAIRIGMQSANGISYILEVPIEKVQFIQKGDSKSTASFAIDSQDVTGTFTPSDFRCNFIEFWSFDCRWHIDGKNTIQNAGDWNDIKSKGPGPMLLDHLQSVTLVLTPEQYQAYLNGTTVPKK